MIDAIWSLQIKDDPLEEWAAKLIQTHQLAELTIYPREGASIFALAAVLFEFIEARAELKPSQTKTEIQFKQLVTSYQKLIEIELHGEDD